MHERNDSPPRAIIVGIIKQHEKMDRLHSSLAELTRLLDTLGFHQSGQIIQHREVKSPRFKIGKGKVEDLKVLVRETDSKLVVFDDDLTPTQARNLQKEIGVAITDRCGVILDIFSQHARTYEAKLQIELAQLQYGLSRLKRQWTHLHRQKGGHGLRGGEGETQLEVDRRMARKQIQVIREKLKKIKKQRAVRKAGREGLFQVAIVGYTNSGKSTLLNRVCESNVLVEDKLFATLDSTTRQIRPEEKPAILITDTVGFIKKLPHQLVASFRSTFEQIQDADLLLHVVDISDPEFKERIQDTYEVLQELGLDQIPRQLVLNKIDLLPEDSIHLRLTQSVYPEAVMVSAAKDIHMDKLRDRLHELFKSQMSEKTIEVSLGAEKVIEEIYDLTRVTYTHYESDRIIMSFRGSTRDVDYLVNRLESSGCLLLQEEGLREEIEGEKE